MHRRRLRTILFASLVAIVAGTGCSAEDVVTQSTPDGGAGQSGSGGGAGDGGSGGGAGEGAAGQAGAAGAAGSACARFVTAVTAHEFGDGQNVGQALFPTPLFGPPKGGGCCKGSLDVVSLGNGGSVTLEFGDTAITDGPGADFIVFENAFWIAGDESMPFAELATVEVSADGTTWQAFPCTAAEAPYGACAGWHPVFANPEENDIDPLDPATAGGDAFDLADVGLSEARWVRITDRPDLVGSAGVFDLDAVGIVNALCP